jgi:hypothetical protein
MTYYLVIYLMACKLYSPILAGTAFLPFAVTVLPVSGLTGPLITRLERYMWAIHLGWLLSVLGSGLLVIIDVNTHPAAWVVIFMCAGAGQGLLFIGLSVAIQASCRKDDAAHAISMYSFMRSLGLCMGVIIGGTIFQNFLRLRLQRDGLPISVAADFEGFLPALQNLSEGAPMKLEIQQAYAWALKLLFGTSTGIAFVGLLLSWKIDDYTLQNGSQPLRRIEK